MQTLDPFTDMYTYTGLCLAHPLDIMNTFWYHRQLGLRWSVTYNLTNNSNTSLLVYMALAPILLIFGWKFVQKWNPLLGAQTYHCPVSIEELFSFLAYSRQHIHQRSSSCSRCVFRIIWPTSLLCDSDFAPLAISEEFLVATLQHISSRITIQHLVYSSPTFKF